MCFVYAGYLPSQVSSKSVERFRVDNLVVVDNHPSWRPGPNDVDGPLASFMKFLGAPLKKTTANCPHQYSEVVLSRHLLDSEAIRECCKSLDI